ncbi:F-box protein CPR1-like [Ipomoea triloba]|uniref:F-box protein CPR1-like n=1 Tax=Ipomoea triloba TaxID=35885 RepID=UPI00125E54E4|nr:F-box protein CPR1-like [Ipomoea triloba]
MYAPIDIIRPILLKLTVEALIRCQCVCKEWRSIIQDPHFNPGQRRRLAAASGYSLDVTSITNTSLPIKTLLQVPENASLHHRWTGVWCSCNGLVLFSVEKNIFLWNPYTRCCTKVLELPRLSTAFSDYVVSGLCYVSSTGDYKVVLLLCLHFDSNLMVASLKNKEWRKVSFPYQVNYPRIGINFQNTLHWRTNGCLRRPATIIYFKAESNEFKELPTPESHTDLKRSSFILGLGIIDCMVCGEKEADEEKLQVWVMKEYGVKESWDNYFSGDSEYYATAAILSPILSYVESIVSPHEFIWRDDQHKPSE